MTVAAVPEPQSSLYETTIENAEVEQALELRERLKAKLKPLRKEFAEADAAAKALADALDIGDDAPVRVGRFLLTRRHIAGKEVAFETEASKRLYIKTIDA